MTISSGHQPTAWQAWRPHSPYYAGGNTIVTDEGPPHTPRAYFLSKGRAYTEFYCGRRARSRATTRHALPRPLARSLSSTGPSTPALASLHVPRCQLAVPDGSAHICEGRALPIQRVDVPRCRSSHCSQVFRVRGHVSRPHGSHSGILHCATRNGLPPDDQCRPRGDRRR